MLPVDVTAEVKIIVSHFQIDTAPDAGATSYLPVQITVPVSWVGILPELDSASNETSSSNDSQTSAAVSADVQASPPRQESLGTSGRAGGGGSFGVLALLALTLLAGRTSRS